jgi:TolA-binding protein
MSTPAENSQPTDHGFDPLAFWIEHKTKVLALSSVLAACLAAYGIYQYASQRAQDAAAADFAQAKSADDFRKVIQSHSSSPVAANAALLLAEQLRNEGKLDEAATTLRKFTTEHPSHPLISGAWNSIATTLEAQGKTDEAIATYQKVIATYPSSFAAPVAMMSQARIHHSRSEDDKARQIYDQVISQFGQTSFARQAIFESQKLKPAAPAAPRLQSRCCGRGR